ncbi:hypothetical protein CHS0354_005184 [Potamilus streckersoni]|uniref:SOCS box domain-containing protein n=1 Tax=Potamilus streckersoni TaxID=2493646 RepID=A0AAE0VFF0_9BIVA|nr:hypothetical protein CHS0354_005184 [Potamilus streckersoni]
MADGGGKIPAEDGDLSDTKSADDKTPRNVDLQRLMADAIAYKVSLDDISIILRHGVEINQKLDKGLRPIHYAAYYNYTECIDFLLERGADVNACDDVGYTPIHLCARRGNHIAMEKLIQHRAIINFCEGGSDITENARALGYLTMEPLNIAIENNHKECVKMLLENGACTNNKYFMGYEINLVALDNLDCLELLLQHGADPKLFSRVGLTPLMKACREHQIDAVRMLIRYGADINAQCPPRFEQKTALIFAIQSGNIVITSILLENGAKCGKPPAYKYSPLHEAILKGRSDLCEMLLKWKADVDERTDDGVTPLMLACSTVGLKYRQEIVEILLKAGADVNAHADFESYTEPCFSPMVEYLRNVGSLEAFSIVLPLIRYGANIHFTGDNSVYHRKDPFGVLPYVYILQNFWEMFQVLVDAGRKYDMAAIKRNTDMSVEQKSLLSYVGSKPRELKHLVRMLLITNLYRGYQDKVKELPLPKLIKSYLTFKI